MSEDRNETRNTAIAAAIILLVAGAGIYFMPSIVLALGSYSPVLGFAAGMVIVLAFFLIFWIRARLKK